ncbi:hypothetical protein Q7C36_008671 [Tachysurus vachellii]|uniref:Uncharacterized protein n=1 Tax=Tachysurus vachellii TaxID=175792 RepID=A0AA88T0H3_TACVA|nr:hypothetical protein Q7C36_008671 [Tachysurus vachellii]
MRRKGQTSKQKQDPVVPRGQCLSIRTDDKQRNENENVSIYLGNIRESWAAVCARQYSGDGQWHDSPEGSTVLIADGAGLAFLWIAVGFGVSDGLSFSSRSTHSLSHLYVDEGSQQSSIADLTTDSQCIWSLVKD